MSSTEILSQFSRNRLNGEPVPDDLKILLPHRDELAERTGIRLELAEGWAPWLDTSYVSEADRRDPDILANIRAIHGVCAHTAFIAAKGDEEFFGYWRGQARRSVANSPLVYLDDEDQFHLCIASSFAEAVLEQAYGGERFHDLRDWLQSVGISIGWDSPSQLTYPHEKLPPKELHKVLFQQYRNAPPQGQ
jgi:hypothetical protein